MGSTVLNCPFLHGNRNGIGNIQIPDASVISIVYAALCKYPWGAFRASLFVVKDQAAVNFRNTFDIDQISFNCRVSIVHFGVLSDETFRPGQVCIL